MDLRDLYEDIILDHNRNPRNYGPLDAGETHSAHGYNPLCGDDVHLHLAVADGVVTAAAFEGRGCAISTASASLLTEAVKGRPVAEVEALFERIRAVLTGEAEAPDIDDPVGDLVALAGVREFPMRVKCATLAWHTLHAALECSDAPVTTE